MQKIAVEKKQAYDQPQVSIGKRRPSRLMVLGEYTLRLDISVISNGVLPESSSTISRPGRRLPLLPVAGNRPAIFPPLFFAPSLLE